MTCSNCRDVVLDIARGVAHEEEAAALDHANACDECRRYLHQQRQLTAGLRALAAVAPDVPSRAMEQRLLTAVEAGSRASSGLRRPAFGPWLKVAAALVLAAAAFGLVDRYGRVPRTGPTPASQTVRPPVSASVHGPATASGTDRVQPIGEPTPAADNDEGPRPVRRVAPHSAARPASPRIVQASAFVPLPSAEMLPPFERGEIIRVRIRLASLANLGFTVQPDAADTTPVNADLLVGQDGQARAIRLVTDTQDSRSRR